MTECGSYQTAKQQNRKHNVSSSDSWIKLNMSHLNSSKIIFSAKPWLCLHGCTSKKKRSSMLHLAEDSTDIFVSRWTLLWENDGNATLIDYRPRSLITTESELEQECERDWKSWLIAEFPRIMISDQIKHSLTQTALKRSRMKNLIFIVFSLIKTVWRQESLIFRFAAVEHLRSHSTSYRETRFFLVPEQPMWSRRRLTTDWNQRCLSFENY